MIEQLAADIPLLWHAPTTTASDRKAIVRHLVSDVIVHVKKDSEYVDVTIHWHGGFTSQHEAVRAVQTYDRLRDYDRLLDRVVSLWQSGVPARQIAERLNEEGFVPPRRRCAFTGVLVRQLLCRRGYKPDKRSAIELGPDEWLLPDLAEELGVPDWKLREWGSYGWLHYRQTPMRKLWVVWADGDEMRRLRRLKAHSKHGRNAHPDDLTTPKKRKGKQ